MLLHKLQYCECNRLNTCSLKCGLMSRNQFKRQSGLKYRNLPNSRLPEKHQTPPSGKHVSLSIANGTLSPAALSPVAESRSACERRAPTGRFLRAPFRSFLPNVSHVFARTCPSEANNEAKNHSAYGSLTIMHVGKIWGSGQPRVPCQTTE